MLSPINHVAIIMDGNGRWARSRAKSRSWGHIRGVTTITDIIQAASDCKIKALTLYAFSTENWSRPVGEIKILFRLVEKYIRRERKRIISNNIKFSVIGDFSALPIKTIDMIEGLQKDTAQHTGLKLNVAFSYGGRKEIVEAVNSHIASSPGVSLGEKEIERGLSTYESGDVDILIRTGGNHRISNFLLWQNAYAEIFFTETLWPDFWVEEFMEIINTFRQSRRRFGSLDGVASSLGDSRIKGEEHRKVVF